MDACARRRAWGRCVCGRSGGQWTGRHRGERRRASARRRPADGQLLWELPRVLRADGRRQERDWRALAVSGSMLVAGSLSGVITGYDVRTHRERWRFALADGRLGSPAFDDGAGECVCAASRRQACRLGGGGRPSTMGNRRVERWIQLGAGHRRQRGVCGGAGRALRAPAIALRKVLNHGVPSCVAPHSRQGLRRRSSCSGAAARPTGSDAGALPLTAGRQLLTLSGFADLVGSVVTAVRAGGPAARRHLGEHRRAPDL